MEMYQLEYVLALEKYMHFSRASEMINVSQPTLSHGIKKLEQELGIDLFIRSTRPVQLTAAG
ncbi:MAG TPA: LysR family transcriptional regulator, partial [Thermoanaerobacterales bacterium]|nr:LysR family transcriptional regulator [Thermoanaerobacterales bacterium]